MTFTIYGAIIHLKMLEKESKMTDDKWEYFKNIITCRLIHFNPAFHTYDNIGLRTLLITLKFCIFEVLHKNNQHKYMFCVFKNNDNMALLASKKNGKPYKSISLNQIKKIFN